MRNKTYLILFACIFLFGQEGIALITKAKGAVEYKRSLDDKVFNNINKGQSLFDQDLITTGPSGFAKYVYLDDGSMIKVHKNAEVYVYGSIDKRSIIKQINVTDGNVKFEVSKQASNDFTVITPTSVATVKGTDFWLESDEDDGDHFFGLSGLVNVKNIESNIIHEEIRNTLRLENNMKAWEGFERLTERIVEKHNFVFFTNVNAKSGTRHLFINIDPPQFFDTVCTANYQYEIINIIEQPESLLPYIEGKKIVLNISNIFGFIDSVKKYSLKELKNSWENLMKVLEKSKYTYFIGEDYFKVNKRIRINYDL